MAYRNDYMNFIKKHEKIREILRQCYITGLNSKDIKNSKRDYNNKLSIIKNFINNEVSYCKEIDEEVIDSENKDKVKFQKNNINKTKYHSFRVENYTKVQNFLFDSYLIKTLSVDNLKVYFYTLQIVNKFGAIEKSKLIDKVWDFINDNEIILGKNDASQFIGRIINKMQSLGILEKIKIGKREVLKIKDDIFEDFSKEEILKLMDVISFYSNLSIIGVPGHFIVDILTDYLRSTKKYECEFESSFSFKKNFLSKILDDEVIVTLLEAIKNNKTVKFKYNSKDIEAIPMKIVTDYNLGRQYLIAQNINYNLYSRYRIDKITYCSDANKIKLEVDFEEYKSKKILVEIDFTIDKSFKSVFSRLEREQNGELQELGDDKYLYTMYAEDPLVLIPWILSFGGLAKVRKSSEHNLDKKIDEHYRKLFEKYNIKIEVLKNEYI